MNVRRLGGQRTRPTAAIVLYALGMLALLAVAISLEARRQLRDVGRSSRPRSV